MNEREVGLVSDPLFVGMTRPPMRWGVAYAAMLFNVVYVQSDPAGLRYSLNTYAYLDGDPTNGIDPLGLGRAIGKPRPTHVRVGVGGCTGFVCVEDESDDDGRQRFRCLLFFELGGGIKIFFVPDKPSNSCDLSKPDDNKQGFDLSFGFGRHFVSEYRYSDHGRIQLWEIVVKLSNRDGFLVLIGTLVLPAISMLEPRAVAVAQPMIFVGLALLGFVYLVITFKRSNLGPAALWSKPSVYLSTTFSRKERLARISHG